MEAQVQPRGCGEVISDLVLPPRGYTAFELHEGQLLRLTDIDGQQACDLVCFASEDRRERLATHPTIMRNGTVFLTSGHSLYSSWQRTMLTIIRDDVGAGGHDLLAGMCTQTSNEAKFGIPATPNCTGNLIAALAPWEIPATDVTDSFNVFMRVETGAAGHVAIKTPLSAAGDSIVFRADMNLLIALSNCPQEWGNTNAHAPSRIGVTVFSGAGSQSR